MKNLLILGEVHHKMLFEIAPDLFPEGTVTTIELMLWDRHYENRNDG